MSALLPPALLLLWSALAATLFAGLVFAPMLGESVGALATSPSSPSAGQGLLAGLIVLPILYLVAFTLLHEANLINGAILGVLQAGVLAARSLNHGGRALVSANGNRLLICIAYGALLGFAYVTP